MKLINKTVREMTLPANYAPELKCGDFSTFILKHNQTGKPRYLKFVIEIYEIEESDTI
jgi:hypothetical protein